MASIARRSPNGRPASLRPTSEWARKIPRSSVLTQDDEAIILAYRWRTRLSLNDCLDRLRRLMPKLSRSTLHRCLRRHGFSRIGKTAKCPPVTSAGLRGPYTFEITANEVAFPDDIVGVVRSVFLAVEEVTKHLYAEVIDITPENAAAFLAHLVAEFPQKIIAVTTDIHPEFTDWPGVVRRRHGAGQSPCLRSRLPRRQDRPHTDDSASFKTPSAEKPLTSRRNPVKSDSAAAAGSIRFGACPQRVLTSDCIGRALALA